MLELCKVDFYENGVLGLNLSRATWNPYPWVSGVQQDSNAERAGIKAGDTLVKLNDCDVFGLKISELALRLTEHWKSGAGSVTMLMWRNDFCEESNSENILKSKVNINQLSLEKFSTCLQQIAQLLECPVCLEIINPPGWQCCNGHLLCNSCRKRSDKCPICRVPLGRRGRCLLSDKIFSLLAESFPCDGVKKSSKRMQKCFTDFCNKPSISLKVNLKQKS